MSKADEYIKIHRQCVFDPEGAEIAKVCTDGIADGSFEWVSKDFIWDPDTALSLANWIIETFGEPKAINKEPKR